MKMLIFRFGVPIHVLGTIRKAIVAATTADKIIENINGIMFMKLFISRLTQVGRGK